MRTRLLPAVLLLASCGSSEDTAPPVAVDASLDSPRAEGSAGSGESDASADSDASIPEATAESAIDSGSGDGSVQGLIDLLRGEGYTVQEGVFELLDLKDCCEEGKSCAGNNPTSPYATFSVPPAPGQTAVNPLAGPNGESATVRLRSDEAIVYLGTTPPAARYFGFTPYLFDRQETATTRRNAFASLSETLNLAVIGVGGSTADGVFEKPTVVIATMDKGIDAKLRNAIVASGWPSQAINTIVFDPTLVKPGIEEEADTFAVLFRVAVFAEADAGKAYLASLPGAVLRLTPGSSTTPDLFSAPPSRPKDSSVTEAALTPAVDSLGAAILAAYPNYTGEELLVQEGTPDPGACIEGKKSCAGDNRDTNYPAMLPRRLFTSDDDFYVVYGVNHDVTGKTTYSNFSVYAVEHLVGIASVSSATYAGSADDYVPGSTDKDKLFAWTVARNCEGKAHCLAIPKGSCPTGIDNDAFGIIAFRTYLEPSTHTAPDPATLIRDRVIRFVKK